MANESTKASISLAEGTDDLTAKSNGYTSGYDVTFGNGRFDPPGNTKPLTSMTITEVLANGEKIRANVRADANKRGVTDPNTSAQGKYQIVNKTLRSLIKQEDISPDVTFTPELQERLADRLLVDAGKNRYLKNPTYENLQKYNAGIDNIWEGPKRGLKGVSQTVLNDSIQADQSGVKPKPVKTNAGDDVVSATNQPVKKAVSIPKISESEQAILDGKPPQVGPIGLPQVGPIGLPQVGPALLNEDDVLQLPDIVITATQPSDEIIFDPKPNPFKEFSSMTYAVSLYHLTGKQYSELMKQGKKDVTGWTLFIQSAGAVTSTDAGQYGAKRSEYFQNDFYIDDIQISSLVSGSSTMGAFNTFGLKFSITEPVGITFFDNLYKMVNIEGQEKNYAAQPYVMVVRFYGYDEDGNQISADALNGSREATSDPASMSEKFIPFLFEKITFEITNKTVVYSCSAIPPNSLMAMDMLHGTIPANHSLSGKTLSEILTTGTNNTHGLQDVLNDESKNMQEQNNYQFADEYEIRFAPNEGWEKVLVLQPGKPNLQTTTFNKNKSKDFGTKSSVNVSDKDASIMAGVSIISFIDNTIQSSSYITSQLPAQSDPASGRKITPEMKKELDWFKIDTEVEYLEFDEIKNDFQYKIIYYISKYKFKTDTTITDFVLPSCFSVHKSYDYWFTGENTEVLDFKQEYNFLWFKAMSPAFKNSSGESTSNITHNLRSIQKIGSVYGSSGSSQGGSNDSILPAQIVSGDLYSPSDQASAKITVVGDPDLLPQLGIFYTSRYMEKSGLLHNPFAPDGSINYNRSEVYIAINYNIVSDYNLADGLMNINRTGDNTDTAPTTGLSAYSLIYRINTLITTLARGKFEQEIDATMKVIDVDKCLNAQSEKQPTVKDDKSRDTDVKTVSDKNTPEDFADNTNNNNMKSNNNYKNIKVTIESLNDTNEDPPAPLVDNAPKVAIEPIGPPDGELQPPPGQQDQLIQTTAKKPIINQRFVINTWETFVDKNINATNEDDR